MRARITLLFLLPLLVSVVALAQSPAGTANTSQLAATRDSQAATVLASTIAGMGGVPPSDSVATGTVHLVAGSKVEDGTVRIATRGLTQSLEEIKTPSGTQAFIHDSGFASENLNGSPQVKSLELGATNQSPLFPLALLANLYADPDVSVRFIASETLGGASVYHLRLSNTHASAPGLQPVAQFTARDVWIDQSSGLPRKFSFDRRTAAGAAPAIRVDVVFSDYRNVNGYLYPFQITKSLNGTVWATIMIQNVTFNNGLTAAEFTVN